MVSSRKPPVIRSTGRAETPRNGAGVPATSREVPEVTDQAAVQDAAGPTPRSARGEDVDTGPLPTITVNPGAKVTVLPLGGAGRQPAQGPAQPPTRRPAQRPAQPPAGVEPEDAGAENTSSENTRLADAGHGTVPPSGPERGATVLNFPKPARKRRRRNVWMAVVGMAAVVAAVVALCVYSPLLAVKTVSISGNKLTDTSTLAAALKPLDGKPLPQVTLAQVQALVKPIKQVKSVSIALRPPSTVDVTVVERVAVALLKNGSQYWLVDPDGIHLSTTTNPAAVPLPLVSGGPKAVNSKTFPSITAVLAVLPKSVMSKLASASASSPSSVQLKLLDGKTVIWGDATQGALKAKVLDALLNSPPPTVPLGSLPPPPVSVYDVSTPNHPVTR